MELQLKHLMPPHQHLKVKENMIFKHTTFIFKNNLKYLQNESMNFDSQAGRYV